VSHSDVPVAAKGALALALPIWESPAVDLDMRDWRVAIGGLAAAIAICVAADRSEGAPVTWQLSGTVQDVLTADFPYMPVTDPALSTLGVAPGVPFTATIVIEPATPDGDSSPDFGNYVPGVLSIEFSAGSYHASGAVNGILAVNVPTQFMVLDTVFSGGANNLFTNPLLGMEVVADAAGTFASDAMPIDPPPLASLHPYDANSGSGGGWGTNFAVFGNGTSTDLQIRSAISSWVRVPEPSLALLVIAAFGGLLSTSRSRDSAD
jgi:hypothetical protein